MVGKQGSAKASKSNSVRKLWRLGTTSRSQALCCWAKEVWLCSNSPHSGFRYVCWFWILAILKQYTGCIFLFNWWIDTPIYFICSISHLSVFIVWISCVTAYCICYILRQVSSKSINLIPVSLAMTLCWVLCSSIAQVSCNCLIAYNTVSLSSLGQFARTLVVYRIKRTVSWIYITIETCKICKKITSNLRKNKRKP